MKNTLTVVICLLSFGTLVALLLPVYHSSRLASLVGEPMSHLRIWVNSTQIYAADNNDRLPNPSSFSSARAMVASYGYRDVAWSYRDPCFNLNLSGVALATIESKGTEGVYWYCIPTKAEFPYILSSPNSSRQSDPSSLAQLLSIQYDRKGVTLAPAEYLADQDPLKETK
jgi:hypothetical protein